MEDLTLELQSNLDKIRRTVFREYLYNVSEEFLVYPFDRYNTYKNDKNEDTKRIVPDANIQCIHIDRWVYDKKEQIIDLQMCIAPFHKEKMLLLCSLIEQSMVRISIL